MLCTYMHQLWLIADLAVITQMDPSPAPVTMASPHQFDDVAHIGMAIWAQHLFSWDNFPLFNWTVLMDRWIVVKGHTSHNSQNIFKRCVCVNISGLTLNNNLALWVSLKFKGDWVALELLAFVFTSIIQCWWWKHVESFEWGQHFGYQPIMKRSFFLIPRLPQETASVPSLLAFLPAS